jgi:hypothetical protein
VEFHRVGVENWLLKDARRRTHEFEREFASEHRLMDVVLGMMDLPEDGPVPGMFRDSITAAYEGDLMEWLPEMTEAALLARGECRDPASVNAFIDAAAGHSRTLTFIETENRKSICGGFLEPAWTAGGSTDDPARSSFVFTLKNHLDIAPTSSRSAEASWRLMHSSPCMPCISAAVSASFLLTTSRRHSA